MSPEQVKGDQDQIGPATDVYALGVMLYQMLTGRLPFSGSLGSVLAKILTEEPPRPREIQGEVDPELEAVCLKAMARRIEDRYASAKDLATDLERLLDGRESTARLEIDSRRRSQALHSRRRVWLILGGALAGLAAVVTMVAVVLNRPERNSDAISDVAESDATTDAAAATSSPPDESWRLPPEPRRYPSLPDAVSFAPPWLVEDESAPFDVAEYFETPVWEDNAAPLYLSAFAEFSTELLACYPESESLERSPLARERARRSLELYDQWQQDRNSVDPTAMDRMLEEFDTGFQQLARAQQKDECVFETGVDIGSLLPHVQGARHAARISAIGAWRELNAGNIDAAIERVASVLRMRRDIGHRSGEITTLVAVSIDTIVCDEILRDVLLHPSLTAEQCDRLQGMLSEHEKHFDDGLRRGWQGAFISTRVMLHDLQYRNGPFSPEQLAAFASSYVLEDAETPGQLLTALWQMNDPELRFDSVQIAEQIDAMTTADFDREVAITRDGFASILELIDRPIFERYKQVSRLWDQLARNPDSKLFRYQIPTILPVFDGHRRGARTLAGFRCLVCLRRWQINQGRVPEDLESLLQQAGISEPILDPYGDGEPLRMTLVDGEPVIYSIGPDGIDDKGLIEWNRQSGTPGDITFRLETRQESQRRQGLLNANVNATTAPLTPADESWRLPPEPRRYPSFPDAISAPPPWLVADEGAPFDIAAHFEMPVREDNAAPLYLDAFYEFNTELEICFPESVRAQRTQPIAERLERFVALHIKWGENPDSVTAAEADAVLQEFKTALQKLRLAQRKQQCVFETGISSTSHLPMASAARQITRVTQMRVWRLVEQGNLDEAIADLAVLSRMTRDLNHGGSLVTILVSIAIDHILCDSLRILLLHPALTTRQCDELFAMLNEHLLARDEGVQLALQQEYILFRIMLHDIQYSTGDFSPEAIARAATLQIFDNFEEKPASPGQLFAAWYSPDLSSRSLTSWSESPVARIIDAMVGDDFAREIPIANDGFGSLLSVFDEPVHERYRSVSRLWDRVARNQDSRVYRYTMPTLLQVFEAYRRNRSLLEGFRCLVCLRRWQINHTDLPPDLESVLQDAGISEVPIDPYGHGEQLRLTVIDGKPIIYSVGPDGIDDQGLIEWNMTPDAPGDITFRLETRDEYNRRLDLSAN